MLSMSPSLSNNNHLMLNRDQFVILSWFEVLLPSLYDEQYTDVLSNLMQLVKLSLQTLNNAKGNVAASYGDVE